MNYIIFITFLAISFYLAFLMFKQYNKKNNNDYELGVDIRDIVQKTENRKKTNKKIDDILKKIDDDF